MVDDVREVQAEVHEQRDAARTEPARSICEAVQRLVTAAEGDPRNASDGVGPMRRRS